MTKSKPHIEHLISFYLDDELGKKELEEFEVHIKQCYQCRQLFGEHQKATEFINDYVTGQNQHLTTELVLAYHDGRISPWQHRVVDYHMSLCESCRKVLDGVDGLEQLEVEQTAIKKAPISDKSYFWALLTEFLEKKRLIPAVATVAAIILILILFLPKANPYAPLAKIAPAPYVAAEIRGDQDEARIIFETGMENYLNKDYAAAEHLLEEAVGTEPQNPQFQFFYAVSLLLNQDYPKGLNHLMEISIRQSTYKEDALWYAAQAQLKLGKSKQAIENLQELVQAKGRFSSKAESLLNEVVKIKN